MPIRSEAAIRARNEACEEMARKVGKLEKRGAIGLDKDGKVRIFAVKPRTSAPDPVRNAFFSKEAVATVLGGAGTYNELRAAAGVFKVADEMHVIEGSCIPDAVSTGDALVGAITYGVAAGVNIAKLDATIKSEQTNTAIAVNSAMQGASYLVSNGEHGNVNQYLAFCKATEPLIAARGNRSTASLDKQVFGGNIPRYFANMASTLASFANGFGKLAHVAVAGASTAAGALGLIGGGAEIVVSHAQEKKALAEMKAAKRRRRGLEKWKIEVGGGERRQLNQGLHRAQTMENARRDKLSRRTRDNARLGYFKGTVAIAVGIALIVATSIATAGLALPVIAGIGGAVAGGCLIWNTVHTRRESKAAKHAKRRQRQAQVLAATHSIESLKELMAKDDASRRKSKVVTVERKHVLSREKQARARTVDVGQNGYVATHIQAHDLAFALGKLKWNPETRNAIAAACEDPPPYAAVQLLGQEAVDVLRMLKATGMDSFKLGAVCHQAIEQKDLETRSALLRPHMSAALGLPWTPEKPLHPKVFLRPLDKLVRAQRKVLAERGRSPDELDFRTLARDFRVAVGEETFKKFHRSMQGFPHSKHDSELLRIARPLPLYAETFDREQAAKAKAASAAASIASSVQEVSTAQTSALPRSQNVERTAQHSGGEVHAAKSGGVAFNADLEKQIADLPSLPELPPGAQTSLGLSKPPTLPEVPPSPVKTATTRVPRSPRAQANGG